jgi:RNA polymerase sigma-70 factor, ECF subfamily
MWNPVMDDTKLQQFVELFVRNQNRIYRFIMTLIPNRTDADDLFQQTSLTLWKTWARYDAPARLREVGVRNRP